MISEFQCAWCATNNRLTSYTRNNMQRGPIPQRCERCGAVHSCTPTGCEVISPQMVPFGEYGVDNRRTSPWQDRKYRPVIAGPYECVFTDIPMVLTVRWTSGAFGTDGAFTHDGKRVNCRTLQKWRGVWA